MQRMFINLLPRIRTIARVMFLNEDGTILQNTIALLEWRLFVALKVSVKLALQLTEHTK